MTRTNVILIILAQVGIILVLSRLMGMLFAQLRQPQVMGEMVAGIMLGPSLLGWLAPDFSSAIFPQESIHYLHILSQLGVIFFLFLIGLELDPKLIRQRGHAAIVISHVSIIAPFLLGAALTLYLYPLVFTDTSAMSFTSVALFMGAAMSITAFPVLARILTERNLHKTPMGAITITCAAVDDVTAWCMLAFVVAIARATGLQPALMTAQWAILYILAMFFLVRPFLKRLELVYERQGRLSQNVVAIVFLLILLSAYCTEAIGIHALFGAFLMGAIMPNGTRFVRHLSEKIEDYTVVFLLPIFFAYTGLKTRINLLNTGELWVMTGLIILVACLGKFGGSTLAARACGMPWRESSAIGILMNTRGLMELVILNIGRELGVITDAVFAMMVIMALVTTALTTPVLALVYPERLLRGELAGGTAPLERRLFTVLIPVADPDSGGALLRIGKLIVGDEAEKQQLLALHLRPPVEREAYRAGLDTIETPDQTLAPLLEEANRQKIEVEPISFISRDVPGDIASIAQTRQANLILMGSHRPVFGRAVLGGTVHRIFSTAPADVAIFIDHRLGDVHRILVPYMGSTHDRLALEMARRMARHAAAQITVLHVTAPGRKTAPETREAMEKTLNDPDQPVAVQYKVVEDVSPVGAVINESRSSDLLVIGVSEEWGLESQLIGWRPQRIAEDSPCSLLIVRKYGQTVTLAPQQSEVKLAPAS